MNGKKLYIIYAAELLLYLLFHVIQIQKGAFLPAVFIRRGPCSFLNFTGKKY